MPGRHRRHEADGISGRRPGPRSATSPGHPGRTPAAAAEAGQAAAFRAEGGVRSDGTRLCAPHGCGGPGTSGAGTRRTRRESGMPRSSWIKAATTLMLACCAGCCITRVMSAGERTPRKLELETISMKPLKTLNIGASKTAGRRSRAQLQGSAVLRPACRGYHLIRAMMPRPAAQQVAGEGTSRVC